MEQSAPPIIAIIGCDGSGKSTVGEFVVNRLRQYGPTEAVHLGKQSGTIFRKIIKWPVIGQFLGKKIKKKGSKSKERMESNKLPELLPALVNAFFVHRRIRRFKRMLSLHEKGNTIVTDRYPQMAYPRAYDGVKMPSTREGSPLVARLADYELNAFKWMTSHRPDLVIRLNVDIDTAYARKPDHDRAALKRKIDITPRLEYQGAPIVDIDSTQPLETVLEKIESALAQGGYTQMRRS